MFLFSTVLIASGCSDSDSETIIDDESSKSSIESTYVGRTIENFSLNAHDFDDGKPGPFVEDQGFTGSDLRGEGMFFSTDSYGRKRLKITWKESEYDGIRRERGHEIKLQMNDNNEVYSGFMLRIPSGQSNNLLNKNSIIWQLYNCKTDGCSNWTAHLELKENDLYLSYRSACVNPTVVKIYDNIPTNQDLAFQIRNVISNTKHGKITIMLNGDIIADYGSINLGFGEFDSNGDAKTSAVGVKMGLYCFDTDDYTDNEKRILYLDNVSSSKRVGSIKNSFNRVDPTIE